jgi:hypothetical protein
MSLLRYPKWVDAGPSEYDKFVVSRSEIDEALRLMRRARPAPAARREEVEAAIRELVGAALREERGSDLDSTRYDKAHAALLALLAPPASDAADRRGGDGG